MKLDHVPQDAEQSSYAGHKKLVYAVNQQGQYQQTQSQGWDVESYATHLAVEEFDHLAAMAKQAWQQGEASALLWIMYQHRMDEVVLSQVTGLWQWRVRRHLKPKAFKKLSDKLLQRYAAAFNLPVEQLIQYQQG